MGKDSAQNLSDEIEVAQARLEGLIEDDRPKHNIEYTELTNIEVLTLATVFDNGRRMYASRDAHEQAKFVHSLDRQLREQTGDLFDSLNALQEPLAEAQEDPGSPNTSSSLLDRLPFFTQSSSTVNSAWRFGGFLILVQAFAAVWNLVSVLSTDMFGIGLGGFSAQLVLASSGVLALSVFTFVGGIFYQMQRGLRD